MYFTEVKLAGIVDLWVVYFTEVKQTEESRISCVC